MIYRVLYMGFFLLMGSTKKWKTKQTQKTQKKTTKKKNT